jgi:hypothetical protein
MYELAQCSDKGPLCEEDRDRSRCESDAASERLNKVFLAMKMK